MSDAQIDQLRQTFGAVWQPTPKTIPKFAANLAMMYTELRVVERFVAAAFDGVYAAAYLFPYAYKASELAPRLKTNNLH